MLLIQVCQIAKKNKNWTMDQMEMMKIVIRMMKPKEQIIKIKMKESHTANTVKAISSGKEKSPCEKMREMLDKRRKVC